MNTKVLLNNLSLKTIYFRLVNEEDASFILSLRNNDQYNKYLSYVNNDINQQIDWIKRYKEKEEKNIEYYFIIHRIDNNKPIGTVRIYDFIFEKNSFCWGSWILNQDKTRYAALETALIIYDFAFLKLGFDQCHMDIRKGNTKVIEFHKKFGVEIIRENEIDYFGVYSKEAYIQIKPDILKIINSQ